ncbi:MAG: hypothetical protein AAF958_07255 [Planctomycetota bacterium]
MRLPGPSARKLLRECFDADNDATQVDLSDRAAAIQHWSTIVGNIDGVRMSAYPFDRDSRSRTLCRFAIPDPHRSDSYYRGHEVRIEHDSDGFLSVRVPTGSSGSDARPLASLDQIEGFVRRVFEAYDRRFAKSRRREKVRGMKTRAMEAQVRKMAEEDGFEYSLRADQTKLSLVIELKSGQLIKLQIPFKNFNETLPEVRRIIADLGNLAAKGLKFSVMSRSRYWRR